jgi:recombination protein RecR
MGPIHELTEMLARLPGLGPRQARRVVQYLLARDHSFRHNLASLIDGMSNKTAQCSMCMRYDDPNKSGLCVICANPDREKESLIVVEHDVDIDAIEASLTYRGLYFVLGGLMPLARAKKDKELRTTELKKRIEDGVTEVIFALSTTPEGDYTARELQKEINDKHPTIKTTLLGRGLSVGAELEYADPETLRSALKNRS